MKQILETSPEMDVENVYMDSPAPIELQTYDILCDDVNKAEHIGNRRLMITMSMTFTKYADAPSIADKKAIAASVVDTVHSFYTPGGRFVKKNSEGIGALVVVEDEEAIEWVYKSLEYLISGNKDSSSAPRNRVSGSTTQLKPLHRLESRAISGKDQDEPMDESLANLILKQHELFTAISNAADEQEKPRKKRRKSKKSKS